MKRFALLLSSVAFVSPALAADVIYEEPPLPAAVELEAPTSPWTGLYVGGQAGVAFNNDEDSNFAFDPDGDGVFDGEFDDDDDDDGNGGFVGGAHVGYDHQIGNFVVGGVVDVSAVDAEVNSRAVSEATETTYSVRQEVDFLATARAKAGVAFGSAMAYGTGGVAVANMETEYASDGAGVTVNEDDDNNVGYSVGGGLDFLATDNISVGAEYLYTDLGSNEVEFTDGTEVVTSEDDFDFHTVWAKASYRFK